MNEILNPWCNPITYAIPFFLLTIGVELAALKWLDHDDNLTGYLGRDARTSIFMGLGSLVTTTVVKIGIFVVYVAIWKYLAPFHVPMTWWGIVGSVLVVDFLDRKSVV